jgi:hypothetical protein
MQQIADWLNTLGLGQYAQRFAEHSLILSGSAQPSATARPRNPNAVAPPLRFIRPTKRAAFSIVRSSTPPSIV